jgi:hypothetical protein
VGHVLPALRGVCAGSLSPPIGCADPTRSIAFSLVAEISTRRLQIKTVALGRAAYNVAAIISNVLTPYMINPTAWNWGNYAGFFWGGS